MKKNKKVLIIDDDTIFIYLISEILKEKNYSVEVAGTIATGMKLLEENEPDLIFLDNQLPDGYGWGKAEYIMVNHPNVQLSLISAMDVPKTTTSSFRIIEKQLLIEELKEIF